MNLSRWTVGVVLVVGCGGDDVAAPDAPTAPMDLVGTATRRLYTDGMLVEVPIDLSAAIFTSFTPLGTGFERRTGTGRSDGTFVVPVGGEASEWYLGIDPTMVPAFSSSNQIFLVGSSTAPDLGHYGLGHPDAAPARNGVRVTATITGLAPWQTTDDLEIISSNAGAVVFSPQLGFATQLAAGATAVNAQAFSWPSDANLVNSARGDATMVTQLVTKTSGSETYLATAKQGTATGFTEIDGSPATLTAALTDVPQNKTLTVHFKRSQFEALKTQVGPGAVAGAQIVYVDALPGAATHGFYDAAPDLVVFYARAGTTDLDATFTYGNPFSTGGIPWDEIVGVRYELNVPILAAGATTPFYAGSGIFAELPLAAVVADGNLTPPITPVRNARIEGMDLGTARTSVGATPMISWEAPTTGAVTSYVVAIAAVEASGTSTRLRDIASFFTKSTSLRVPDTILAAGSYVVFISAFADPGHDMTMAPFLKGLPRARSIFTSAQFSP